MLYLCNLIAELIAFGPTKKKKDGYFMESHLFCSHSTLSSFLLASRSFISIRIFDHKKVFSGQSISHAVQHQKVEITEVHNTSEVLGSSHGSPLASSLDHIC